MAQTYGSGGSFTVRMTGPVATGGVACKLTTITLPASDWKGAMSPYSQVVEIDAVSVNSRVDLQPSAEQLEAFREMDISLTTENCNGVVTVYAIGKLPAEDLAIQATILEVTA